MNFQINALIPFPNSDRSINVTLYGENNTEFEAAMRTVRQYDLQTEGSTPKFDDLLEAMNGLHPVATPFTNGHYSASPLGMESLETSEDCARPYDPSDAQWATQTAQCTTRTGPPIDEQEIRNAHYRQMLDNVASEPRATATAIKKGRVVSIDVTNQASGYEPYATSPTIANPTVPTDEQNMARWYSNKWGRDFRALLSEYGFDQDKCVVPILEWLRNLLADRLNTPGMAQLIKDLEASCKYLTANNAQLAGRVHSLEGRNKNQHHDLSQFMKLMEKHGWKGGEPLEVLSGWLDKFVEVTAQWQTQKENLSTVMNCNAEAGKRIQELEAELAQSNRVLENARAYNRSFSANFAERSADIVDLQTKIENQGKSIARQAATILEQADQIRAFSTRIERLKAKAKRKVGQGSIKILP